ncbi:MAG: hypothetical protein DI570_00510 [Phenylobacterium zucineum]|nr:MAG: hypothetical protein DI570_00510 [Phenylobacterium zucineum]
MPSLTVPARSRLLFTGAGLAAFGFGAVIVALNGDDIARAAAGGRLHAPDIALILRQPPQLIVHALAAISALGLGAVALLTRKGSPLHRTAGWSWVVLMAVVAIGSFQLVGLQGHLSPIHIMSGLTLVLLPLAVHAARAHAVSRHRLLMLWLYGLVLVGSAAFAFVPGRLMWEIFFG